VKEVWRLCTSDWREKRRGSVLQVKRAAVVWAVRGLGAELELGLGPELKTGGGSGRAGGERAAGAVKAAAESSLSTRVTVPRRAVH